MTNHELGQRLLSEPCRKIRFYSTDYTLTFLVEYQDDKLKELVDQITDENRHPEYFDGTSVGNEIHEQGRLYEWEIIEFYSTPTNRFLDGIYLDLTQHGHRVNRVRLSCPTSGLNFVLPNSCVRKRSKPTMRFEVAEISDGGVVIDTEADIESAARYICECARIEDAEWIAYRMNEDFLDRPTTD